MLHNVTAKFFKPLQHNMLVHCIYTAISFFILANLAACSGNTVTASTTDAAASDLTSTQQKLLAALDANLGAKVLGLKGELKIAVDGATVATITKAGSFTFALHFTDAQLAQWDLNHKVAIVSQPANQTCSILGGDGEYNVLELASLWIRCDDKKTPFGGTATALLGEGILLGIVSSDGSVSENFDVIKAGSFSFDSILQEGQDFTLTIIRNPTQIHQTCLFSSGSDSVVSLTGTASLSNDDYQNLSIVCTTAKYKIQGAVHNLAAVDGSPLNLKLNDGSAEGQLVALDKDGFFVFDSLVDDGSAYTVSIVGDAPSSSSVRQTCTPSHNQGTVQGANVRSVRIICSEINYTVGGTLQGLADGATVSISLNGVYPLTLSANGSFKFIAPLAVGSDYAVTIVTQPVNYDCALGLDSGHIDANIDNVQISCVPYLTVKGTVSGLLTDLGTITATLNAGDETITLSSDGSFSFTKTVSRYTNFSVTVQDKLYACSSTGNSGIPKNFTPVAISIAITCHKAFFFSASPNGTVINTYKTDGTAAGTQIFKSNLMVRNNEMIYMNGALYLVGAKTDSNITKQELWKIDGTDAGSFALTSSGSQDVYPKYFTVMQNKLYFLYHDSSGNSFKLFKTDGTIGNTLAFLTTAQNSVTMTNIYKMQVYHDKLFFIADDNERTKNVYYTSGVDGSAPHLLVTNPDVDGVILPLNVLNMSVMNDKLYFFGNVWSYSVVNNISSSVIDITPTLWSYNDADSSLNIIEKLGDTTSAIPTSQLVFNNKLYFTFPNFYNGITTGWVLWSSDGVSSMVSGVSQPGTHVDVAVLKYGITNLSIFTDKLFFYDLGRTPYISDGSTLGTSEIKSSDGNSLSGDDSELPETTIFNGRLYFGATDGIHDNSSVWSTDGTSANTTIFGNDLSGDDTHVVSSFYLMDNTFYYWGKNHSTGSELWSSDGTNAGSYMVKDINPGEGFSSPNSR